MTSSFENTLRDLANVSIALFEVVVVEVAKFQKNVTSEYEELVRRGAADKSETAESLRDGLAKGIDLARTLGNRFGFGYAPFVAEPALASKARRVG